MSVQKSFFDEELTDVTKSPSAPQTLKFQAEFITEAEEASLLEEVRKLNWREVKMHGVVAKRKVAHFGVDYTFDRRSVSPTHSIPNFLKALVTRVASFMNLPAEKIGEVLITHYPAGAAIGWHRDAPPFGDAVAGISLLSDCTMKFRRKVADGEYEIFKLPLPRRSAYLFADDARWKWEHTISQHKAERYSITFRTLREITS